MQSELIFRLPFAFLLLAVAVVRIFYHLKSGTFQEPLIGDREPHDEGVRRLIWNSLLQMTFLLFIFFPDWLNWSHVPLPDIVRWFGLGTAVLGSSLLVWVQHSLRKQFSATLRIRPDQDLVVTGPYRLVRHPMYTALILLWGGLALLSANGLILLLVLLGIDGLIRVRTPLEEAMMLDAFGDSYREYRKRTGRFLPRWRRNPVAVS